MPRVPATRARYYLTEPIGPKTVTVLGSHWNERAPWRGFSFSQAELLTGSIWSNDDYHLRVPWIHPDDQKRGMSFDEEDFRCYYRVRLKRGWRSFVRCGRGWRVSKKPRRVGAK